MCVALTCVQVKPLAAADVQTEELAVVYSADMPPHIQNDCITISTWVSPVQSLG